MSDVLSDAQVQTALADLPDWTGDARSLQRTVQCPSFPTAIDVVVAVGGLAERLNHHPDIDIRWRTLTFHLSTHSAGGVTDLDVDLARAVEALLP